MPKLCNLSFPADLIRFHLILPALILYFVLSVSTVNCAAINRTSNHSLNKGPPGAVDAPVLLLPGNALNNQSVLKDGVLMAPAGPAGIVRKQEIPVHADGILVATAGNEAVAPVLLAAGSAANNDSVQKDEVLMAPAGPAGPAGIVRKQQAPLHADSLLAATAGNELKLNMGAQKLQFVKKEQTAFPMTPVINVRGVGNAGFEAEKAPRHEPLPPAPPHIVPLNIDEVQPPDHVDGLRMEQDGHLNRDYKKEILIGNHEEFEQAGSEKRLLSRLKIIFIKADKNHDAFLTHQELKSWIMLKVQEHLDEAKAENLKIFQHLDTDQDGYVSWKEFHVHFLLAKGHGQNDTLKHVEDYDSLAIDPEERERLIRYKFRWAEADEEPQDNQLTVEEMQNFRHPEQSAKMIVRMAKDIIDNLDHNEDGIVTEEEFVMLPRGDIDDMMHERNADETWQAERRKEFQNVIDINHDGKVDLEELKIYVDPHNENHAHLEADNLIQLADENSDGKLSMSEVLDNAELFLGSKMVDTGRNFHDEF